MIISAFAIIGACVVSLVALILFTFLSRIFIAIMADVIKWLIRKPSKQFSQSNKNTANDSGEYRYKFNPIEYAVYGIQFLYSPLCLLCDWLEKGKFINNQRDKENQSTRDENAINDAPEMLTQPVHSKANLSREKKASQPKENPTMYSIKLGGFHYKGHH
jgi:hypothetical protein